MILGHYGVIGAILQWANPIPSGLLLRNDSGPSGAHRHYLVAGQLHAIDGS